MLEKVVETKLMTAEELAKLPPDASRGELIKGVFHPMSPAGHQHGHIAGNILFHLAAFVRKHKIGRVYAAETGFSLTKAPDTVRAPDAAFVNNSQLEKQAKETGFFQGAPDLAVEVIPPSESAEEIKAKVSDYLKAGTRLVWLIYPTTQTVTIYRSLTDIQIITIDDTLDGGELLPGFAVAVRELFE